MTAEANEAPGARWLSCLLPPLGVAAVIVHLALGPIAETDLFFHLAMGAEQLRSGHLPHKNLFSFTYPDHPYLDPAWLFDRLAIGLERALGLDAFPLVKTALLLLVFLAAYRRCRRRGANAFASAITLAAAAFVMAERFVERPHLASFGGELALLFLLDEAEARPRRLWLVLPLVALWANLHAGAFVAPCMLLAAALGSRLDGRGSAAWAPKAVAAVAAALALLATPVGTGIFAYLAFHRNIAAIHAIDEFRAPSWRWDLPLFAYALGALALLAGQARAGRLRFAMLGPPLVLAALTVHSVRFGADAALTLAPLVAVALSELAPRLSAAAAPVGLALLATAALARLGTRGPWRGLEPGLIPTDAIDFVAREGLDDRMYNDLEIGGYLAWRFYPRRRVFVDPRLPAYPRELHALLGRADLDRATWSAALDRYGVESALLAYAGINRRVAWWDPAVWALVYRAHDARVFVRRGPATNAIVARLEIPATFVFDEAEGIHTIALAAPPAGSPVPDCEWSMRLADLSFELDAGGAPHGDQADVRTAYEHALAAPPGCLSPERLAEAASWLGAAYLRQGRARAALDLLGRALAVRADDVTTLANRALAFEALGRRTEAAADWRRLATIAVDPALVDRAKTRAAAIGP